MGIEFADFFDVPNRAKFWGRFKVVVNLVILSAVPTPGFYISFKVGFASNLTYISIIRLKKTFPFQLRVYLVSNIFCILPRRRCVLMILRLNLLVVSHIRLRFSYLFFHSANPCYNI